MPGAGTGASAAGAGACGGGLPSSRADWLDSLTSSTVSVTAARWPVDQPGPWEAAVDVHEIMLGSDPVESPEPVERERESTQKHFPW